MGLTIGKLYFIHADGTSSFVCEITEDKVLMEVSKYIEKLNPNYVVCYFRTYEEEKDVITIDCGSHTEFFKYYKGV